MVNEPHPISRELRPSDCEWCNALLREEYPGDKSELQGQPVQCKAGGYVCEVDNVPVGFVTWVERQGFGYIENMYVHKDWQGKKRVGPQLIQKMQEVFCRLCLHVHKQNHKAIRFYRRFGFDTDPAQGTHDKRWMVWVRPDTSKDRSTN